MFWRKLMIGLATNSQAKRLMQNSRRMSALATRFIGGQTVQEFNVRSQQLIQQGKRSSAFYLGEYVRNPDEIARTIHALEDVIKVLQENKLDIHISVDPTQIGLMNGVVDFRENAFSLVSLVRDRLSEDPAACNVVMIDMEDTSVTQATLDVYHDLCSRGLPCGVTLQAYLHRSASDLERIVEKGGMVRLVKGAFAEPDTIAYTTRKEINLSYLALAKVMLSDRAKQNSLYPIFGTHDDVLIDKIIAYADDNGWKPGEYEFEFLLGVRENLQNSLVKQGHRLRLYVPFGTEWWAYSLRRVGEQPKNAAFLLRSLFLR